MLTPPWAACANASSSEEIFPNVQPENKLYKHTLCQKKETPSNFYKRPSHFQLPGPYSIVALSLLMLVLIPLLQLPLRGPSCDLRLLLFFHSLR